MWKYIEIQQIIPINFENVKQQDIRLSYVLENGIKILTKNFFKKTNFITSVRDYVQNIAQMILLLKNSFVC